MACAIKIHEKPKLNEPILIEGLPGIGFVANIAALHLIKELKAKLFAEILSASFQDLSVTDGSGKTLSPVNELYYCKRDGGNHDLIIWYGNTQALTIFGQYELCGRVLDIAEELGCRYIITLGGFKKEELQAPPEVYCAASDLETLNSIQNLGVKIMVGQIFGVAGLLLGLGKLRSFKGFSLLAETLGTGPDVEATRLALSTLSRFLNMDLDLSSLDEAGEKTRQILESFGLIRSYVGEEKKKEEQQFRWSI